MKVPGIGTTCTPQITYNYAINDNEAIRRITMHKSDEILDDMAILTVQVIQYIELKRVPYAVKDQLIRAISNVGANYTEAQNASSKRDFLSKVYVAKKESSEAKYWLGIIERLAGKNDESAQLMKDIHGFSMMMQKIINTSKEKTASSKREVKRPRALSTDTRNIQGVAA